MTIFILSGSALPTLSWVFLPIMTGFPIDLKYKKDSVCTMFAYLFFQGVFQSRLQRLSSFRVLKHRRYEAQEGYQGYIACTLQCFFLISVSWVFFHHSQG